MKRPLIDAKDIDHYAGRAATVVSGGSRSPARFAGAICKSVNTVEYFPSTLRWGSRRFRWGSRDSHFGSRARCRKVGEFIAAADGAEGRGRCSDRERGQPRQWAHRRARGSSPGASQRKGSAQARRKMSHGTALPWCSIRGVACALAGAIPSDRYTPRAPGTRSQSVAGREKGDARLSDRETLGSACLTPLDEPRVRETVRRALPTG